MRKITYLLILISSILLLSSCSLGTLSLGRFVIFDNDDKLADARLEQVLKAIENQDKDSLEELFSKKARSQAEDFDTGIDYLFELFQGENVSWEAVNVGPIVDATIEYGKTTKELKSWYNVVVDRQTYVFFLLDYPQDTLNPDNAGLYALRVVKTEDKDAQLTYWQDMMIPGIYVPK